MLILQALAIGILQGLTEFIPISSSAHLIIVPWLLKWNDPALISLPFDVALHLGTLLAILVYFATDWIRLLRAGIVSILERKIGTDVDRRMAWFLVIGCIPGGIVGVLAESKIEQLFHQPNQPIRASAMIVMAIIIALFAFVMFTVERLARHTRALDTLTLKDTLIIGLAQALAVFPGVSRSGSTITAGIAINLERQAAARFSFLLGAPLIAGTGFKAMWEVYQQYQTGGGFSQAEWILFPIGFCAAAITGFLCIKYLLRYLQRNSTDLFAYYRWALAVLIIIVALVRK